MKKRVIRTLSALLASMLILGACVQEPPTPTAPTSGNVTATETTTADNNVEAEDTTTQDTLIVIVPSMPVSLDPHVSNDMASALVNIQMRETLITRNWNTSELEPGLAVAWDMPDAQTVNMELRQGVYFHDGSPFTAHDVQFTFERALASPGVRAIVEMIDEVVINDDHNITILLNRPFAAILAQLTHSATQIVSANAVLAAGDNYHESPIGTGAFMFDNIVLGDRVEFVRFDNYWREPAAIRELTFRVMPEATTRLIEVETGSAGLAIGVNPNDIPRIENSPNLELHRTMNVATAFIGFNTQAAPFDDYRVRQAINYALDTDGLVDSVFMGSGQPVHGFLPDTIWAFVDLEPYTQNIERARELMAEAGLADGFSTTIWYNSDSQQRGDIAVIVQNQLRELNIDVTIEAIEWGTYLSRLAQGEHDMFVLQWANTTGEPDNALFNVFHSSNHGAPGNRQFYTNLELDRLIEESRSELDHERRRELFAEIQQIIRDDAPLVFLHHGEDLVVAKPNLRGFEVLPTGAHLMRTVYFE